MSPASANPTNLHPIVSVITITQGVVLVKFVTWVDLVMIGIDVSLVDFSVVLSS